jgi:hypothetical protein
MASWTLQYEHEEKTARKLVESEKKKLTTVTTALSESEARKGTLTQQYEDNLKVCRA